MWNRVLLHVAPVNRAELVLYKVVETKTQRSCFRKMGVVLVFEGVEVVLLER